MTQRGVTSAESRGRRGQGDGKDRSQLDAGAASWQQPKAQAGYRGCGSDGNSSDRSPGSPRMTAYGPPWARATDSFRTTASPTDSRAGNQASPGLAPW